jgi:flagellar operon protein
MSNAPFLYPNVTSLPGQSGVGQSDRLPRKQEGSKGEFDQALDRAIQKPATGAQGSAAAPTGNEALEQVKAPLKFSAHASQRLRERKIELDPAVMAKVSDAVDKADAKGIDDTLVLTKDVALIVNVKNRTVITAMDRAQMTGNVFTNIDGAVIV